MSDSASSQRELLTLLVEQRDLYQRLRDLSQRQRSLVSENRPESLLNILSDRQQLIQALAKINHRLSGYRSNWEDCYARLTPEAQRQASALLEQINLALAEILKADREDTEILSARRFAVSQELSQVGRQQAAGQAYTRRSEGRSAQSADITT